MGTILGEALDSIGMKVDVISAPRESLSNMCTCMSCCAWAQLTCQRIIYVLRLQTMARGHVSCMQLCIISCSFVRIRTYICTSLQLLAI